MTQKNINISDLIQVIETLRGPGGCPWDREQTPEKMGKYLVEEAYEAFYEIEKGNDAGVCEELGDLLFLVCFITNLYKEAGKFDLNDVIEVSRRKMVRRHPHVFADGDADTSEKVIDRWIEIKKEENRNKGEESILDSIPTNMAPLKRAYKVSSRAAKARFDWPNIEAVLDKLDEEICEMKTALRHNDEEGAKDEIGDVFFTLANVARFMNDDPERLTNQAVNKFEKRFRAMEKNILAGGRTLRDVSEEEKEEIWRNVKRVQQQLDSFIFDFTGNFYE